MRPDATRTLAPYMLARASAFGEEAGPAYTIEEDVATLTIEGPLYQRAVSMCGFALADGYDAIEARASAAFADSKAGAVLMAIDSPGGDAAGVMELADRLASMSADSGKALIAYASESAASAAYWLASSASSIVVPRTGEVGSIGAICVAMNKRGAMDAMGLRAIVAAFPAGKSAGWDAALAPPDGAAAAVGIARMQARAEELARLFAGDVAQRRGMTIDDVLALDAAMLSGGRAIDARIADVVGGRGVAMALARSKINRRSYSMGTGDAAPVSAAEKVLATLCAAVGLDVTTATPEAVEAASRETARTAALGRSIEAATGQQGDAAGALVVTWREGAESVPTLVRRVKLEALGGRLATVYPPAARYAPAPATLPDGRPHPRAGLPDPSAGLAEDFERMSLAVFDARTAGALPHTATATPPTAQPASSSVLTTDELEMCKRDGIDPVLYAKNKARIYGVE
jgi:ClpP class serine protease